MSPRLRFSFVVSAALAVGFAGPDGARAQTVGSEKLSAAANALGLQVLREHVKARPNANVAFSPFSLAGALTLLGQGAAGKSAEKLLPVLGGAPDAAALAAAWSGLREGTATQPAAPVVFTSAGGLWHTPGAPLDAAVQQRMSRIMGVEVRPVDFAAGGGETIINAWVENATGGLIPRLLDPLPGSTELTVASVLAFKGDWASPFDTKLTRNLPFIAADGTTTDLPVMSRSSDRFFYRQGDGYRAVMLPYADPAFALALALPENGKAATTLFAAAEWLAPAGYGPAAGTVALPKITVADRHDLTDAEAGPTTAALLAGGWDLSGFGDVWKGRGHAVTQAVQVVSLRWDENGAEAAAATAAATTRSVAMRESAPFVLTFDRPFAFALVHIKTDMIVVAGVINKAVP